MKVHSFRLARRIVSGRRALAGLTGATAALSLLILSLTPHPGPDPRVGGQSVLSHGHQRRIQQEAAGVEDYGEPRRGGYNGSRGADDPLLSEVKVKTVKEEVEAEVEAVVEEEEEAEVVKAKVVDIPKEARAEGAEEEAEDDDRQILSKARETAITALQHGFKLTEGQKRLLERMSPTERQEVESKVSKIRALQEKVYLQQLRSKGQVRPRRGGGEEVVSTPQQPIRFPAALKKVHPRDWPLQYTIFLNLHEGFLSRNMMKYLSLMQPVTNGLGINLKAMFSLDSCYGGCRRSLSSCFNDSMIFLSSGATMGSSTSFSLSSHPSMHGCSVYAKLPSNISGGNMSPMRANDR